MGLQVWLPLNGNLDNQGLSDQTSNITTTPIWSSIGKIGGKSLYTKTQMTTMYFPGLVGVSTYSVAYWVYIPTAIAPTAWADIFGIQFNCGGTTIWERDERRNSDTDGQHQYCLAKSASEGSTTNPYYVPMVDSRAKDNWVHMVLVKDDANAKIYINGILHGTWPSIGFENSPRTMTGNVCLGTSGCEAYLQDFRIYDHALSPREVKELSKGLVLHYPLAMPGGENLLKNSLTNFPELWSGSGDGRTLTTQSGVLVPEWGCNDGLRVYGKSGASSALCLLINDSTHGLTVPSTSVSGQKYTISIYIKNNHQNAIYIAFNGIATGQFINQGEIKKVILNATGNGTQFLQFTISASGVNKEYDFTFWHPKIELGEVCTPWVPATTDSLYSTMGFNDGIEYDVSGYGHNGTKTGAFAYDSDTPRYNTSTVFSGSNHIAVGRLPITDELTYSWWGYMDDWSSLGGAMMCSVEGGGMGQQKGGSTGLWFICGTGTTSNNYGNGYQMPIPSAGWHMFTETWDGYRFKVYLDGELKYTNERYTTKTPVYYSQSYNFLFLGGESGGSATTPGDHFIGKLSDARVYATALSADDILELYHAPISLSNNGTLLTQGELVES